MQPYIASFDVAAIIVCLACLAHMLLHHHIDKRQNKFFLCLLAIIALGSICSVLNTVFSPDIRENFAIVDFAKYWYFALHTALGPLFYYYMLCVSGMADRCSRRHLLLQAIPFLACEVLVLTNPLTSWTYYFDQDFTYYRNWVIFLVYGISLLYLTAGVAAVLRYWHVITPVRRMSLMLCVFLVLAGVFTQLLFPLVRVELFAEALAMMGLMFSIENEDDRIDAETGVYTRAALLLDFANSLATGSHLNIVCVRLVNASLIMRAIDQSSYSGLMRQVAGWLKTLAPRYRIYRASPTAFVLASLSANRSEADQWAMSARKRFAQAWRVRGMDVPLRAAVIRAALPEEFSSPDDVLLMADSPLPVVSGSRILSGSDLNYIKRRSMVERAVARGLEEGNFEVFYQPICRADGTVCGAEALMRLHDPVLGNVPPDEFIEVAEGNGAIDRIGLFALREVCRFLAGGGPTAAGVERIHVNLSVVQCLQPGFADEVRRVVREYGVDPGQLNFEITESIAASDDGIIAAMMTDLGKDGFRFSMDDYGTGYSSTHSVFSLDFEIVKIDKSILWDADKNDSGRLILENTMRMMHDTGHKTVVEGVETQGQTDLLRSMDVDFLQGFLYSRPLPESEFLEKVQELSRG